MEIVDVGLELRVAAAKVGKYATRESGDTLEMIERPRGGLSFVLVDGQSSGRGAKAISNMVARKVVSLLGEGVRDGAAARAAHDYLFTQYQGKVRADLTILSLDLTTHTVVLSRNMQCPAIVRREGVWSQIDESAQPVGLYAATKPAILEFPFEAGTWVVVATDGLWSAGRSNGPWDVLGYAREVAERTSDPEAVADALLRRAVELDSGRPADDISVLALGILPRREDGGVRRLAVRVPI
ncbi:MAG: SpoIIE family protein phosphatase [Anaerolineales bacterium]